ncbi:hypothetical protein [Dysgonomonas alginatilytica]|nr:hypothetical protein [Dysgonomonas alginatilytica]
MTKYIVIFICLLKALSVSGQVGVNTRDVHSSAILEISSPDKGFLMPRVALLGTLDVATVKLPATGLLVFNTKTSTGGGALGNPVEANNVYYWTGTEWSLLLHKSIITEIIEEKLDELRIPKPAIYELRSNITNFLNTYAAGYAQLVPMAELVNSIPEYISFNASTNRITFQPGTYNIEFTYAGIHTGTCTLSSYYVDFPTSSGETMRRIHSTATHVAGTNSNHGGVIICTTRIVTTPIGWTIQLGRGQSGNCSSTGNTLNAYSTQVSILRLGD